MRADKMPTGFIELECAIWLETERALDIPPFARES